MKKTRNVLTMLSFFALSTMVCVSAMVGQEKQDDKKAEKEFDAKSLIGSWRVTGGWKAGEEVDVESQPGEIVVDEKHFTMPAGPDAKFVMAYTFDAKKSPMEIDFEILEGPAEGTALGIFKLEDGKFSLCYDPTGQSRPDSFESNDENKCFKFVMGRADSKFDTASLKGTWEFVSGSKAGEDASDESMGGEVIIDEKTITLPVGEDATFVFSYKIDASASPATIDLKIEEGPVSDGEAAGIVKMVDGEFTLCYHPMGGERPDKFESNDTNGCYMFVMKKKDN